MTSPRVAALAAATLTVLALPPATLTGQTPSGRQAVEALEFGPLQFAPPVPERHEVSGVRVLLLEDRDLPLVSVYARFRGGYGLFAREWYAPAMGLPALLRAGGTTELAPDSVDQLFEFYSVQASFGTGGGSVFVAFNTLTEHLSVTLGLWRDLLARPRFDADQIELWRGRELEAARRRGDDPGGLAYREFNRLLYGEHPVGWEMSASDLDPALVTPERFREMHRRIVCRENLILGVTGDASWGDVRRYVEELVGALAPCPAPLPEAPAPDIRREPGIFLIERDLEQAFVVMAHPVSVRLADDPTYFAATIGNSILGGGGLSSRLLARLRTRQGYAYAASSLWTTPVRYDGLVGAITSTRPDAAVSAIRLILDTMDEMRVASPTEEELRTAVDGIVNGFAFNFATPDQIVSRMMFYLAEDWPEDWLERYARGVQAVTPAGIRQVFADHVRPDQMMILVVGDAERIGRAELESLGPVTVMEID